MANISPGVYTKETDVSAYVRELGTTQVAMIGTTVTGPTTPTYITTAKQFVDIFGSPHPDHYLPYAALAYLNQGTNLWVTRVTSSDAKTAKMAFPVPANLTQYTANWELKSYDSVGNTMVLALANDVNMMVDATGLTNNNLWVGTTGTPGPDTYGMCLKSLATTIDLNGTSVLATKKLTINSGPGRGAITTVTPLASANQPAGDIVLLQVDASKFDPANSPINYVAKATITPVSFNFGTMGAYAGKFTNELASGFLGATLFANSAAATTAIQNINSPTLATQIAALEALTMTGGTGINLIAIGTSSAAVIDAAKSVAVINAFLSYLANNTMAPSAATAPKLSALHLAYRARDLQGEPQGLGISLGTGISKAEVDTLGRIVLTSIAPGAAGIVNIDWRAGGTATWTISGTCALDIFRPTFVHETIGVGSAPVFLKLYGKGATDLSNIAPVFGMYPGDVTSTGEQNYSLRIYKRKTSAGINATSMAPADFDILESFYGPLQVLRSQIVASSTILNATLDYSVDTAYVQETGTISSIGTDNMILVPYYQLDTLGKVGFANLTTIKTGAAFISTMYGGKIGTPVTASDIIGDPAKGTGIYGYSNPEVVDINLLLAPGWSADPAVAKALTGLCESRSDCMTIIDTPFALNVQEVVDFRKVGQNINSNYAAEYYPWIRINDSVNKREVYVPPSGHVAAQYAFTDRTTDVHYAPAGRNRGQILAALATERALTQGDRDLLCANNINPIHNEAGNGIYIKGQYTLQTQATALDRVNVRRMMLQLRKTAAIASRVFEFEPLDAVTTRRVRALLESVLEDRLRRGHISFYSVDINPTANELDNSTLTAKISLVPTKSLEILVEDYVILGQGGGAVVLQS